MTSASSLGHLRYHILPYRCTYIVMGQPHKVRVKLELWLGWKFDPNKCLTLTLTTNIKKRSPYMPLTAGKVHTWSKIDNVTNNVSSVEHLLSSWQAKTDRDVLHSVGPCDGIDSPTLTRSSLTRLVPWVHELMPQPPHFGIGSRQESAPVCMNACSNHHTSALGPDKSSRPLCA